MIDPVGGVEVIGWRARVFGGGSGAKRLLPLGVTLPILSLCRGVGDG